MRGVRWNNRCYHNEKTSKSWTLIETSESMEGLIINFAIVFALVLTLIVTTAITFPQRSMLHADFLGLLCSSQEFRHFTVSTLQEEQGDSFNFTRQLGPHSLDMQHWLLVEADSHPLVGAASYRGTFGGRTVADCNGVPEMSATFELMVEKFPIDLMLAWHAWHRDEVRVSDTANWYAAAALGASCSGLVISIALYVSLMTSPVRTKSRAFRVWLMLGFPAAMVNVLVLILAIAFAYEAIVWYLIASSTDWPRHCTIFLTTVGAYTLLPTLVVSFLVAVASTSWAHLAMDSKSGGKDAHSQCVLQVDQTRLGQTGTSSPTPGTDAQEPASA